MRACTVSDGAGGGRCQCADLFQLFVEPDRTSLHPARRQAVLHPVLRTALRQQVRGMQTGDWNRLQGWATSYAIVLLRIADGVKTVPS